MSQIMIPAIAEDGTLYSMEKLEAHKRGVLHLAISAFVFAHDGKLLIQRRAHDKYHCGGKWANTCCSHPHWGEAIDDCAHRRMHEELGFTLPLQEVGVVEYRADVGANLIEHERVHMFCGTANSQQLTIQANRDEVAETRWIDIASLRADMQAKPEDYAPWFRIYMDRWLDVWAPAA